MDGSLQKEEKIKDVTKSTFSLGSLASTTLAVLALVAAFLAFIGYGVALSVETEFGIPHANIFKSSFDLLTLSVWFFTWTILTLSELFKNLFFSRPYWEGIVFVAGFSLILMATIFALAEFHHRFIKGKFLVKSFNLKTTTRLKKYVGISLMGGFISGLAAMLSVPFLLALVILLSSFFSMVPMLGLSAGQKHIRDDVISPKNCEPVLSRDQRIEKFKLTKRQTTNELNAECVKIVDGGKVVASGRVAFSTTDIIVLFDPETGAAWRETIGNKSIEAVSQLPKRQQ